MAPHRTVTGRRAAVVLCVLAGVLAGCASDPAPARPTATPTAVAPTTPAPTPEPTPAAAPELPDVPVRSSSLDDQPVTTVVPPVEVTLPTIGVTVPVDPVGVRDDGQMEIPPLAERAGWYRFGAAPGTPGATVIAAHVDSVASAGLGPFARLQDLAAGDAVSVVSADGTARSYVVTDVTRVPKTDVTWQDVFTRGDAERVVLVTCGGTFRRDVSSYTDNVIVTAVPDGG